MEDALAAQGTVQGVDLANVDFDISAFLQDVEVDDSPFDEYVMDCPVCKRAVRYFFINFNEKFKMCENKDCDWPFGYEDLQFVKHDEMFASDEELDNITVKTRPTATGSIITTSAWSDIDKLNETDDSSDVPVSFETDEEREAKLKELLRQKDAELQTQKNLRDIKKLNIQLQQTYDDDEVACIKNQKWIKHLKALQGLSGVQLLKKEELAIIKKEELGIKELTIGINTDNYPSITINLGAPSTSTTVPMDTVENGA